MIPVPIDPLAAQCLANERQRDTRRKPWTGKRRAEHARKVKKESQMPWNRGWPKKLYVCDSVKALLPKGSDYR